MGIVSVNLKKIKASTSANRLVGENYRSEKDTKLYNDGHRNLKMNQTKENVFLIERPENYDQHRAEHLQKINTARSTRQSDALVLKNQKRKLKESGKLKAESNRQTSGRRKLRRDTVDVIGEVVQPDAEFINSLSHDEQIRFFKDALAVMQARPDYFGRPETAVIHFDETTPHMQVLASALDDKELTSKANIIFGNKTKMSNRQDILADGLKAKGWNVSRGMKRVDNPKYRNFKNEAEAKGYKVTRFTDARIMAEMQQLEQQARAARAEVNALYNQKKALSDEYTAQWGDHKTYMTRLRAEHEKAWRDPEMCEKWDTAALRLKRAKEMQYDAYGSSGALGACIRLFGMIRQYTAQWQLEELEKQRKAALEDVEKRQQAEREKWAQEKTSHKAELAKLKKSITISTEARDSVQAQVQEAQKALKSAQKGLLPYQKKAASALENAKFWNTQSKKNLSAYDMKRVKNAVKDSDKEISLSLNDLKDDGLQL